MVGLARSGIAAAAFLARRGASRGGRRPEARERAAAGGARAARRRRAAGARRRTGARPSRARRSSSSRPACPGSSTELEAARQRGRPGDRRDRARRSATSRGGWPRSRAPRASRRPPPRSARCCARPAWTRAWAATSARRSSASSRARPKRPRSPSRSRASSSRASCASGPHVAVWLNLSPDHLDRHPTLEAYVAAKARVFAEPAARGLGGRERRRPGGAGRGAPRARAPAAVPRHRRAARLGRRRLLRGRRRAAAAGRAARRRSSRAPTSRCRGRTWPATCWWPRPPRGCSGAPADAIARAVRGFRGVEHVLEHVATIDGVAFYNDSKATNVEAARRSLEAFSAPVVVILGGRYKGGDFARARAVASRPRPGGGGDRRSERNASRRRSRGAVPLERGRVARATPSRRARSLAQARATWCCSPRPARPSTCSGTTPSAAARSRPRSRGSRARPQRRARVARKLNTDLVLLGVTLALFGFGLVMVWSASLGARAGAPRQPLLLPAEAGGLGHARARGAGAWRCGSTTRRCGARRSSTRC